MARRTGLIYLSLKLFYKKYTRIFPCYPLPNGWQICRDVPITAPMIPSPEDFWGQGSDFLNFLHPLHSDTSCCISPSQDLLSLLNKSKSNLVCFLTAMIPAQLFPWVYHDFDPCLSSSAHIWFTVTLAHPNLWVPAYSDDYFTMNAKSIWCIKLYVKNPFF